MFRPTIAVLLAMLISPDARGQAFWAAPTDSFEASIDDIHVSESGAVFVGMFLGGMHRSADGGATWEVVSDSDVEQFAESGGVLFAAGLDGLLASTDDGVNWEVVMPSDVWSVSALESTVVAGGTGGQLYVSEDAGSTWRVANCALMPEGYDGSVYPVVVTPEVFAYRHSFEAFFRSADGGASWSRDPSRSPSFLVFNDGMIFADDGGDLLRSTDASAWSFFAETPFFSLEDATFRGDRIAIASFSGAVSSADGGQTWADVSEGLAGEGRVDAIAIGPDGHAYAAVGHQVQRSVNPIEGTGTAAGKQVPAVESELLSPYPNPAGNRMRIPFVVARPGSVEIALYDELGKRITMLLAQDFPAGKHEIDWQPRKLANGTYFVRLTTAGETWSTAVTFAR